MKEELNKFIKENCIECEDICEKGITVGTEMIKCGDTGKYMELKSTHKMFTDEDIEVRETLIKLGISANLKGFKYILYAVAEVKKDKENQCGENSKYIYSKLSNIFNEINGKNGIKDTQVERAIRTAIAKGYSINNNFSNLYETKPRNMEFICDLAFNLDVINKNLKKL